MDVEKRVIHELGLRPEPVQKDGLTPDGCRWRDSMEPAPYVVEVTASVKLGLPAIRRKLAQAASKAKGRLIVVVAVEIAPGGWRGSPGPYKHAEKLAVMPLADLRALMEIARD